MKSKLKELRLKAGKTQKEVAKALDVTQPTYQRWESIDNSTEVPETKIKRLALCLGCTVAEIQGGNDKFDIFGIDETVPDERTYYGEVAIHFASGNPPLMFPITEHERQRIEVIMDEPELNFLFCDSLDNRTVIIPKENISDLYVSSDDVSIFGPEPGKYGPYVGVCLDDDFWTIIEFKDDPDELLDEFAEDQINGTLELYNSYDEEYQEFFYDLATAVKWQLTSGQVRTEHVGDYRSLLTFAFFDDAWKEKDSIIPLEIDEYYQTAYINTKHVDYITIPTQKYTQAMMEDLDIT